MTRDEIEMAAFKAVITALLTVDRAAQRRILAHATQWSSDRAHEELSNEGR